MYMLAYRDLGIFQENVVNRILRDIVKACKPESAAVTGDFTPRGGLESRMTASYSKNAGKTGKK
jgi:7-cyano-7-deazaguanine reductase